MEGIICEFNLPYCPSVFYFTDQFKLQYHVDPMTEVYNVLEIYLSYITVCYVFE